MYRELEKERKRMLEVGIIGGVSLVKNAVERSLDHLPARTALRMAHENQQPRRLVILEL